MNRRRQVSRKTMFKIGMVVGIISSLLLGWLAPIAAIGLAVVL